MCAEGRDAHLITINQTLKSVRVKNTFRPDKTELDHEALEYFFNSVNRLFVVINPDGRIRRANLSFRRFTGPSGAADDVRLTAFLEPKSAARFDDLLANLAPGSHAEGQMFRFKVGFDRCDIHADVLRAESGEVYFSGRDVTREYNLETSRNEAFSNLTRLEGILGIGHWRILKNQPSEWSSGMYRLYGLDEEDGPPRYEQLKLLMSEEDGQNLSRKFKECMDTEMPLQMTYTIETPTGEQRVIEVAGSSSKDAEGRCIGLQGIALDRTDSVRGKDELLSKDTITRQFLDHVPTAIVVLDLDRRVSMVSNKWLHDTAKTEVEVLGRIPEQIWPELSDGLVEAIERANQGEKVIVEDVVVCPHGYQQVIKIVAEPWYENDRIGGCIITHSDTTEALAMQRDLAKTRDRLNISLNMIDTVVWDTDLVARQHHVEGNWNRFTESAPPVDFFPRQYMSKVDEADRENVRLAWHKHAAKGTPFRVKHRMSDTEGRSVLVETSVQLFRNEETGKPVRIVGCISRLEHAAEMGETRGSTAQPLKPVTEAVEEHGAFEKPVICLLVAEDNPMNRRILATLFNPLDIDVHFVENGEEAVDAARDTRYDAILMDLRMPVMDGFEATAKIRELEASHHVSEPTPIFALTAHATKDHAERARNIGMTDFLEKPIKLEELCRLLEKHVKLFRTTQAEDAA
ncbi:MAG: hypothetical protein CME88_10310 [Hirschia sp.]|nr:hypothetical protein [Hirschia sp.]MBF18759.1 hypothetical protein [Hirschia sp.]